MSKLKLYIESAIRQALEEENISTNMDIVHKKPTIDEEEKKKGRRYIPYLFPAIPAELRGTHFRIVKGGDGELSLYVSPYVKLGLESLQRGRSTIEKEFKEKTALTRYISEKLSPQTRGAIKKGLDGSKLVNFGNSGQMIRCNVKLKEEGGEYYVINPYYVDKEAPTPKPDKAELDLDDLYDSLFNEGILNESFGKFKTEVRQRTKSEQLNKAIKHAKKRLQEIDRIVEYTQRIKSELMEGEEGIKLYKATERNINEMKAMVESLNGKIKSLNT